MSLARILKFAEIIAESGDIQAFNSLCVQFSSYIRKYAHYEPKNDGTTPNVWKKNLDYGEESPYYGSVSEFMKKFPGGIKDWVQWRKKNKKNRYKEYGIKKRKACLEHLIKKVNNDNINIKAHFEPVGPDNTKDFPDEPKLWSGKGLEKYKSIEDFIKERTDKGQSADDAKKDAVQDFINYWKSLRKNK